jgi:hypothetical protein
MLISTLHEKAERPALITASAQTLRSALRAPGRRTKCRSPRLGLEKSQGTTPPTVRSMVATGEKIAALGIVQLAIDQEIEESIVDRNQPAVSQIQSHDSASKTSRAANSRRRRCRARWSLAWTAPSLIPRWTANSL